MTTQRTDRPALRPGGLHLLPLLFLLALFAVFPSAVAPAAESSDIWSLDILAQSDSRAELRPCT